MIKSLSFIRELRLCKFSTQTFVTELVFKTGKEYSKSEIDVSTSFILPAR